jgi:hypothetical protein
MLGKQWWNQTESLFATFEWIILVSASLGLLAFITARFLFFRSLSPELIPSQTTTNPRPA